MAQKRRPLPSALRGQVAILVFVCGVMTASLALTLGRQVQAYGSEVDRLVSSQLDLMVGTEPSTVTTSPSHQRSGLLLVMVDTVTGEIVASTDPTGQAADLLASAPPVGGLVTADLSSFLLTEGSGRMRLGARPPAPGSTVATHVAVTLEPVDRLRGTLVRSLAAVGVGLLVAVGAAVAIGSRRLLRPVEALRAEVMALTSDARHHRLRELGVSEPVDRLAAAMNRLLTHLDRATERQRQFVADASHELRSPLAAIRSQLEVAIEHPSALHWSTVAPGLLEETRRVERLVDDLLLLASANQGARAPARSTLVDLDDLVLAQVKAVPWPASVWVDLSQVSAGLVNGDADQLTRLVRNLLDNAARHATRRVAVALGEHGNEVLLVVDDDGPGVPDDQREAVFERFVRLDEGRARHQGGTGLGLAIVREVARAHGGDVAIDRAGPGASFVVRLPRAGRVHYAEVD